VDLSPGVRLLGVGVSNLAGIGAAPTEQMRLDFDARASAGGPGPPLPPKSWRHAAGAVDAVRDRFGDGAVGPATLLGPAGIRVKRPGDTQWGPPGDASGSDEPSSGK
jgi:hypothetical protein